MSDDRDGWLRQSKKLAQALRHYQWRSNLQSFVAEDGTLNAGIVRPAIDALVEYEAFIDKCLKVEVKNER